QNEKLSILQEGRLLSSSFSYEYIILNNQNSSNRILYSFPPHILKISYRNIRNYLLLSVSFCLGEMTLVNKHEHFDSRLGFILASAGSAIGLGALWEFPYMTGQAGGGAFFITFLMFTFLVGLPILLSEYIIGRSTQKDAIRSFKHYSPKKPWHVVGRWGIVGSIIL